MKKLLLVPLIAPLSLMAGTLTVDFEEAGALDRDWTQVLGAPNASFAEDPVAGVGASGGLVYELLEGLPVTDITYVRSIEPVGRFGEGSLSFKFRIDSAEGQTGNPVYVGLTKDPNGAPSGLTATNTADWFGVMPGIKSDGTAYRSEIFGTVYDEIAETNQQFRTGAGQPQTWMSMVNNTWIQVVLTIEKLGNGDWDLVCTTHILNDTGTEVVTEDYATVRYSEIQQGAPESATLPLLSTITDLSRSGELYLVVGSRGGQAAGMTAIDDIVVTLPDVLPEFEPTMVEDFETSGSFESNWSRQLGVLNGFEEAAAAGTGSSGGLIYSAIEGVPGEDITYIHTTEPVGAFGSGSIKVKFRLDSNGTNTGNPLYIGLTPDPENIPTGLTATNVGDWFGIMPGVKSDGTAYRTEVFGTLSSVDPETFEIVNSQFRNGAGQPYTWSDIIDNTWIQAVLTIVDMGQGEWDLIATTHILNEDGTEVLIENYAVWSYSETQLRDPERATLPPLNTILDLYRAGELYLVLGSRGGPDAGLTAIDDIEVSLPAVLPTYEPTFSFDFESADAITAGWTKLLGNFGGFAQNATAGVGATGGLGYDILEGLPAEEVSYVYTQQPVGSFGNGSISVKFRIDSGEGQTGNPILFGFTTTPDEAPGGINSVNRADWFGIMFGIRGNGENIRSEIYGHDYDPNSGDTLNFRNGAGHPETWDPIVNNTWYQSVLTIIDLGGGEWDLVATTHILNEDGTEVVTENYAQWSYSEIQLADPTRGTLPPLSSLTALYDAPELYVVLGTRGGPAMGLTAIDDLEGSLPPVADFSWLGSYQTVEGGDPWIYLPDSWGWTHPYAGPTEAEWFYSLDKAAYFYTSPDLYPMLYLWSASRIEWAYSIEGWLYGYSSGEWFQL